MREDFINNYLQYRKATEPPVFFHRWSILSAIGAYLARDVGFELGDFTIYPNMYAMLIGVPGTRKSTAIKLAKKLIQKTGYDKFSADKSSKEKFILDLAGDDGALPEEASDLIDENLWGASKDDRISEMFIACDEFNNFIGNGNLEFISLLGEFWDYSGVYSNRIKNGKSVRVPNPTISILGGNTATGFSLAFPSQAIGQGFFSRLILVYSEPSTRKITFPEKSDEQATTELVQQLIAIKALAQSNTVKVTDGARLLLDKIYKSEYHLEDIRFEHYANRRFTHLLKLCLIHTLARTEVDITEEDVVCANTILTHTEKFMPKALGEFGESRNAKAVHKIISTLESSYKVMTMGDIWKHLSSDLEKPGDLSGIMGGLLMAGKVLKAENGFLAKRQLMEAEYSDVIDYGFLSEEECGPVVDTRPARLEVA